jgi:hypothetical protein
MALDTQSIIAVIALLITCPPTVWLVYKLYMRRRNRGDHGTPYSCHFMLIRGLTCRRNE